MLRQCLDENGLHKELVEELRLMNSRLVSPKMVFDQLSRYPRTSIISNQQLKQLGNKLAPKESAR